MKKVLCQTCLKEYSFKDEWFKKNTVESFVCRNCKIRIRTQSATYRKKQSDRSKRALADPNVRERMSQRATLNNVHNADKISTSIKKYYEDFENRQKARTRSKKNWQNPTYRQTVSKGLKKKWQDPHYRGKVLGSRISYRKRNQRLAQLLTSYNKKFITPYTVAHYEFDALIEGKYLYDEQHSREKRLFIEHYFKNFIYINDLSLIEKSES